jgi:NAD(P)-dependent dehydrogenase (short-subunit alcohol dehydrogenase family)
MKKISFFGGSSGLAKQITPLMNNYEVNVLSSKDVDITNYNSVKEYFDLNHDVDVVIIFSNYNFNSFLHKYDLNNIHELNKQIDVNINGVNNVLVEALKVMRNKNYGRIILSSSITSTEKVVGTSIYSACKTYYESLVKSLGLENANKGITANCIQLGYMDGGLTYKIPETILNNIMSTIPIKRLGTPEEIFKTIDFIINNEYINGTTIKLTGGL